MKVPWDPQEKHTSYNPSGKVLLLWNFLTYPFIRNIDRQEDSVFALVTVSFCLLFSPLLTPALLPTEPSPTKTQPRTEWQSPDLDWGGESGGRKKTKAWNLCESKVMLFCIPFTLLPWWVLSKRTMKDWSQLFFQLLFKEVHSSCQSRQNAFKLINSNNNFLV